MKFAYDEMKDRVWNERRKLRDNVENKRFRLREDVPKKLREWKQLLLFIVFNAKKMAGRFNQASVRDFVLYLDRVPYYPYDIRTIPDCLHVGVIYSPSNERAVVFFTRHSLYSNHFRAEFEVRGDKFGCVEQYLAVKKAEMAGKNDLLEKAQSTNDPTTCKGILYTLRSPQVDQRWYGEVSDILYTGLLAKFSQNFQLAKVLVGTAPKQIGEASTNRFWGIGMTLYSPDCLDTDKWKGKNVLGVCLMKVRAHLLANPLPDPEQENIADPWAEDQYD